MKFSIFVTEIFFHILHGQVFVMEQALLLLLVLITVTSVFKANLYFFFLFFAIIAKQHLLGYSESEYIINQLYRVCFHSLSQTGTSVHSYILKRMPM